MKFLNFLYVAYDESFTYVAKASDINEYSNSLSSMGQLLYSIFVFILMIAFIFWASKFLRNKNLGFVKSQNLDIVDKISLGVGNSIAILRCGESYVLVSITKDRIEFLKDLNKDELTFVEKEVTTQSGNLNFSTVFNNFLKTKENDKGDNDEEDK